MHYIQHNLNNTLIHICILKRKTRTLSTSISKFTNSHPFIEIMNIGNSWNGFYFCNNLSVHHQTLKFNRMLIFLTRFYPMHAKEHDIKLDEIKWHVFLKRTFGIRMWGIVNIEKNHKLHIHEHCHDRQSAFGIPWIVCVFANRLYKSALSNDPNINRIANNCNCNCYAACCWQTVFIYSNTVSNQL